MGQLIGIFTSADDPHLQRLIPELKKRKLPFIRFDRADFPQHIQLTAHLDQSSGWHGTLYYEHTSYSLEEFQSILYRRPTSYHFIEGLSPDEQEFARLEAKKGFEGVLQNLNCLWVNHPDALQIAEWKPRQLQIARELGLRVPKTLITNDASQVFLFFQECQGKIIYKTLSVPPALPRNDNPEIFETIFTTRFDSTQLQNFASTISNTANLYQEYIPKVVELRINIIGKQLFATEIHSQNSERTQVDWRRSYADLTYSNHTLPKHVELACFKMLAHLNLQFAAIDMILTDNHEYVFLELNCNGQWGWIETVTKQPLTEAFIDLLAHRR